MDTTDEGRMGSTGAGILVVGVLTVESTRADGSERAVEGTPDTVQFWMTSSRRWKFRTLAIDHDLLAWDLGDLGSARDHPIEFAQQHIEQHYGDILRSIAVVNLPEPHDAQIAAGALRAQHLAGALQRLEVGDEHMWLWSPDGCDYWMRESE